MYTEELSEVAAITSESSYGSARLVSVTSDNYLTEIFWIIVN